MSTRSQQQGVYWLTAKAYAVRMGLPYPIRMRNGSIDLQPGKHPIDNYIKAMVNMLGKDKAAMVLGVRNSASGYDTSELIIDEASYYEETGKLFPPGVTTREEAERLEKEKP